MARYGKQFDCTQCKGAPGNEACLECGGKGSYWIDIKGDPKSYTPELGAILQKIYLGCIAKDKEEVADDAN